MKIQRDGCWLEVEKRSNRKLVFIELSGPHPMMQKGYYWLCTKILFLEVLRMVIWDARDQIHC